MERGLACLTCLWREWERFLVVVPGGGAVDDDAGGLVGGEEVRGGGAEDDGEAGEGWEEFEPRMDTDEHGSDGGRDPFLDIWGDVG